MEKEIIQITDKSSNLFISKIILYILTFGINIVGAKCLGADIYGEFIYIFTFISFMPILAKLGLDQGIISFIPKLEVEKDYNSIKTLVTLSILIVITMSILIICILFLYTNQIATSILNNPELKLNLKFMIPMIILLSIIPLQQNILRAKGKINYMIVSQNIMMPVIKIVFVFVLSMFGFKMNGIIIAFYLSMIIASIYLFVPIMKFIDVRLLLKGDKKLYKEYLKFSIPLLLAGFVYIIINKLDTLMIGYFLSDEEVGIYNIAFQISIISNFVLTSFDTIFAPIISTLYYDNKLEKLSHIYKTCTKWIVSSNLIIFGIILLFSNSIMRVFGEDFIIGSNALVIMSIGQIINAAVGSAAYINTMTGHPEYELYVGSVSIFINVALNYILIPIYKIEGAAFASLVTVSITNIMRLVLLYKNHRIHPYNSTYIKVVFANLISFFIVKTIKNIISINWFLDMVNLSIIYLILVIMINLILGVDDNDRIMIDTIINKFNIKNILSKEGKK